VGHPRERFGIQVDFAVDWWLDHVMRRPRAAPKTGLRRSRVALQERRATALIGPEPEAPVDGRLGGDLSTRKRTS